MKLLSVGKLIDYDCIILFTPTSYIVQDHIGRMIGTGCKVSGLYQLECNPLFPDIRITVSVRDTTYNIDLTFLVVRVSQF